MIITLIVDSSSTLPDHDYIITSLIGMKSYRGSSCMVNICYLSFDSWLSMNKHGDMHVI